MLLADGILKLLVADRSNVFAPGPTSGFLGLFPYCKMLRAKAAVLNQRSGVRSEAGITACWPGTRLGRWEPEPVFWVSPPFVTLNGEPLCSVTRPPKDQPPSTSDGGAA